MNIIQEISGQSESGALIRCSRIAEEGPNIYYGPSECQVFINHKSFNLINRQLMPTYETLFFPISGWGKRGSENCNNFFKAITDSKEVRIWAHISLNSKPFISPSTWSPQFSLHLHRALLGAGHGKGVQGNGIKDSGNLNMTSALDV